MAQVLVFGDRDGVTLRRAVRPHQNQQSGNQGMNPSQMKPPPCQSMTTPAMPKTSETSFLSRFIDTSLAVVESSERRFKLQVEIPVLSPVIGRHGRSAAALPHPHGDPAKM